MSRALNWVWLAFSFFGGALLAASFPTVNLPWLAWVAPALILYATYKSGRKSVFSAGFVAGMGHYLGSLSWLLLIPFRWHAIAGWLGVSSVLSLFFATWCWLSWRLLPRPKDPRWRGDKIPSLAECWSALTPLQRLKWPLLCAAAWVAIEMILARIFTGFAWNFLGASQFRFLPLIQLASITGVYGVSFLVMWGAVSLLGAILLLRNGKSNFQSALVQVALPMLVIGCVIAFGLKSLSEPENANAKLKIALVQPAIPQRTIWDGNEKTNRFLKLLELSRTALASQPDLLVWPETALPDLLTRNRFTQESIVGLLRSNHAWMVIGANDSQPKRGAVSAGEQERFNGAFLINPDGELVGRYNKQHLVMFGEYMPFAREFPFLTKLRTAGAGLVRGERDVPFQIEKPRAKFSVLICFEDIFPHEARRRVNNDTDFLLNLTNDGWFGEDAAQWQHGTSALFRAVENGVPLVRCTNNGLTCWIDGHGRIHEILFDGSKNIYQSGYKIVEVPLRSNHAATFYNRHGDWFGWSCVGIVLLCLVFSNRRLLFL